MRDLSQLPDLKLALVQTTLVWHDAKANRERFDALLEGARGADLVILPEMFTTGFSMDSEALAEAEEGETYAWLREQSAKLEAVVCGSVIIRAADGSHRNRLLWARPDGEMQHYDKRHLFRMAGEHKHYTPGEQQVLLEWKGWRIRPLVCYDLRFPVFCRNRYNVERPGQLDFDLQIFVANWPSARAYAWKTLLRARAIENLCFVAAVNRIGVDGNQLHYAGDSAVIDFLGQPQVEIREREQVVTTTISAEALAAHRARFPAMLDADAFHLDERA